MLEYILDASIVMYAITVCSILALAVIMDRWRVFKMATVDATALREEVLAYLYKGQVDDAVEACKRSHGPVAAVLLVGVHRFRQLLFAGRSINEIEANVTKAMDDYIPHAMAPLERRVGVLSVLATVTPLLGMTGTVTGMIASFAGMADIGGLEGNKVAAGVSEALVCTAAGLFIAIPAAMFYHVFTKKIDHTMLDISRTGTALVDFIAVEQSAEAESEVPAGE